MNPVAWPWLLVAALVPLLALSLGWGLSQVRARREQEQALQTARTEQGALQQQQAHAAQQVEAQARRLLELEQALEQGRQECSTLRSGLGQAQSEAAAGLARLEGLQQAQERLQERLQQAEQGRDGLQQACTGLESRLAALSAERASLQEQHQQATRQLGVQEERLQALQAELEQARRQLVAATEHDRAQQEKLAWSEQTREALRKEFELLSARVLEQRAQQLQTQQSDGLESLLRPFREQLSEFRQRVDTLHSDGAQQQAALREQLGSLQQLHQQMHQDALNLTQALKGQNKVQGNWGEMILERILEDSGLVKGREYDTQVSMQDAEGRRQQPDVIVHLPEDKAIIVDSKVSLVAYERYSVAELEEERRRHLQEHVRSLRQHVKGLSEKRYEDLPGVRALDFVLLFVPLEGAFLAAMDADSRLYQDAYAQNIVLVSPTTLMVTLRTIHNIWRYEYQNRHALDIASRAGRICDQVSLIHESLDKVGRHLEQAQGAWADTRKRLVSGRGNLLTQAHKLQALGARAQRRLPAAESLPELEQDDDQDE